MRPDLRVDELDEEWDGGLRRGTREWRAAWAQLVAATGDRDRMAKCPETKEVWGYVSSFRDRGRWVHEFRHKNHPRKQTRWYVHVPASEGWTPDEDRPEPTVH